MPTSASKKRQSSVMFAKGTKFHDKATAAGALSSAGNFGGNNSSPSNGNGGNGGGDWGGFGGMLDGGGSDSDSSDDDDVFRKAGRSNNGGNGNGGSNSNPQAASRPTPQQSSQQSSQGSNRSPPSDHNQGSSNMNGMGNSNSNENGNGSASRPQDWSMRAAAVGDRPPDSASQNPQSLKLLGLKSAREGGTKYGGAPPTVTSSSPIPGDSRDRDGGRDRDRNDGLFKERGHDRNERERERGMERNDRDRRDQENSNPPPRYQQEASSSSPPSNLTSGSSPSRQRANQPSPDFEMVGNGASSSPNRNANGGPSQSSRPGNQPSNSSLPNSTSRNNQSLNQSQSQSGPSNSGGRAPIQKGYVDRTSRIINFNPPSNGNRTNPNGPFQGNSNGNGNRQREDSDGFGGGAGPNSRDLLGGNLNNGGNNGGARPVSPLTAVATELGLKTPQPENGGGSFSSQNQNSNPNQQQRQQQRSNGPPSDYFGPNANANGPNGNRGPPGPGGPGRFNGNGSPSAQGTPPFNPQRNGGGPQPPMNGNRNGPPPNQINGNPNNGGRPNFGPGPSPPQAAVRGPPGGGMNGGGQSPTMRGGFNIQQQRGPPGPHGAIRGPPPPPNGNGNGSLGPNNNNNNMNNNSRGPSPGPSFSDSQGPRPQQSVWRRSMAMLGGNGGGSERGGGYPSQSPNQQGVPGGGSRDLPPQGGRQNLWRRSLALLSGNGPPQPPRPPQNRAPSPDEIEEKPVRVQGFERALLDETPVVRKSLYLGGGTQGMEWDYSGSGGDKFWRRFSAAQHHTDANDGIEKASKAYRKKTERGNRRGRWGAAFGGMAMIGAIVGVVIWRGNAESQAHSGDQPTTVDKPTGGLVSLRAVVEDSFPTPSNPSEAIMARSTMVPVMKSWIDEFSKDLIETQEDYGKVGKDGKKLKMDDVDDELPFKVQNKRIQDSNSIKRRHHSKLAKKHQTSS